MKKKTGRTSIDIIKKLFESQWINGNLEVYMQSVKRRVKEAYGIELVFSNKDEFIDELVKYKLLTLLDKET